MKALLSGNEVERLKTLYRYKILDTPPEEVFDELTRLAAYDVCKTPVALITFVDANREWFKSKLGLDILEISRDVSFGAHAILQPDNVFIVPDVLADERFKINPMVTSDPKIRFYAGVPLVTPEGFALGTLCVMGFVPKYLSLEQTRSLRALGHQVMAQLELRYNLAELAHTITEHKLAEEALKKSLDQLSKKNRYETIITTVTRSVHKSIDLQEVLENAVEAISENIDEVDMVSIFLVEGQEAVLKAHKGIPEWFVERLGRIPYPLGFTWKTIIDEKPIYVADVDQDTFIGPAGRELGTKSYISMPIHFEGKAVGALNINSFQKNAFDKNETNLLEIVAQQIRVAIGNAKNTEVSQKIKEEAGQRVKERTEKLSEINEELKKEIAEQRRMWEEQRKTNEKLTSYVKELEQRNYKSNMLNEMGDLLQAGLTTDEAYTVITKYAQKLFPADSGALYILNDSQNLAEAVALWGESVPDELVLVPDKCWALRRGRAYVVENPLFEPLCQHLSGPLSSGYLCVPMMVQSKALGLLHLRSGPQRSNYSDEIWEHLKESAKQQLAIAMAEHIALALANLELRDTLRDQAVRDSLTGLFNRRYMEETLQRELGRAIRKESQVGIVMMDIDHFKQFNDTFGHAVGDFFLRKLATFLQVNIRREDIASRYGGEEFILVLPGSSLEDTWKRAEQLRKEVKRLNVQYRGQYLGTITLSMGVAAFPEHGLTIDSILQAADEALYLAKTEGRDRVVVGQIVEQSSEHENHSVPDTKDT